MAQFPSLKTGVVAQYPSTKEYHFSTETRRFVDGSEQRYRNFRGSRQRWVVNLSQLDESEIAELVDFFRSQQGRLGAFDFEDPWSQTVVTNCHFEQEFFSVRADGEFDSRTGLVILGPTS